jgi:hypothetical protein
MTSTVPCETVCFVRVTRFCTVQCEYEILSEKGIESPFPSAYMCEFSAVTATKTKHQYRLNLMPILRISLTNLTPDIDDIRSHIQAHPSRQGSRTNPIIIFPVIIIRYNVTF